MSRRIAWPWGLFAAALILSLIPARSSLDSVPRRRASHSGPLPSTFARGIEMTVYDPGGVRSRVSAGSLAITTPKLLGPFRLGVYRRLVARDVELHLYLDEETPAESTPLSNVAPNLTRLAAGSTPRGVASIEVGPLRVVEHRGPRETLLLEAQRCRTGSRGLLCWNGSLASGTRPEPFRRASFDRGGWRIEALQPEIGAARAPSLDRGEREPAGS